jgi:hypothetical protein
MAAAGHPAGQSCPGGGRVPPPSRARAHPPPPGRSPRGQSSNPSPAQPHPGAGSRLGPPSACADHQRGPGPPQAPSRPSTDSTPTAASPPTPTTATDNKPSGTGKPPSPSVPASPSPPHGRTTPTQSCGWPARTTGPPTPPAPPTPRRSANATAPNGSAPNANHGRGSALAPRRAVMAADNQTTIAGNLVEDPELRFTATAPRSPTCGWRSPNASRTTASGATATPPSSRSTSGAAKLNTWPTPSQRATGSWSPADCANGAGRPPRERSGRWPRSRLMRSAPASSSPPPRSNAPLSVATATAHRAESDRPNAVGTSTSRHHSEHPTHDAPREDHRGRRAWRIAADPGQQ